MVLELVVCGRDETRKQGEEKSRKKTSGGHLSNKRLKIYNTGQPVNEQKTRKLKSESGEDSNS